METVSIRKLYNQFKKCPEYETLSYPYFKFLLMKKLDSINVPGKSLVFTFNRGFYYHDYFQVKVSILNILKAMKISKEEFIEQYKGRRYITILSGEFDG